MTDTGSAGIGIGLMLAVVAIFLSGAYLLGRAQCHARWEGVAIAVDFGPIQGCMITLKDGTRIPASAYREIK